MSRIVIENLSKVFRGPGGQSIRALNNASLAVNDKELLVLVGPSGCGKTTTLRLIAGLEEVSAGTISIDGQVVNDLPPKARDVAMVFQHHALYPHLSVFDNIAFGLKLRLCPNPEIEKRVREAAEMLDLTDCLARKPDALSGGQRQRVAVGRAIVRRPGLFLFDEPLSNLDAQMRVQMRAELSRIHKRLAATMIYVTHDQEEAMTLGARIAVMKDGFIHQVAEPINVYQHPADLFVAGFIGSPPMNFFPGTLVQKAGALFFQDQIGDDAILPNRLELQLATEIPPALRAYLGKNIILGIRPEHISLQLSLPGVPPHRLIEAVVEVVEFIGPETCLHLSTGGHSFAARVPSSYRVSVNQKVSLIFDMTQAHFFDPASQKAIV